MREEVCSTGLGSASFLYLSLSICDMYDVDEGDTASGGVAVVEALTDRSKDPTK